MFQSGLNKASYPEVHVSAAKAFGVAVELTAQIEPSSSLAEQLALAVWTMAHGFAMLRAEGALVAAGAPDPTHLAESSVRRLLGGGIR